MTWSDWSYVARIEGIVYRLVRLRYFNIIIDMVNQCISAVTILGDRNQTKYSMQIDTNYHIKNRLNKSLFYSLFARMYTVSKARYLNQQHIELVQIQVNCLVTRCD